LTEVRWIACDLVTGRITEELPNLKPTGAIGEVMGSITTAQFTLPIPLRPAGSAPWNWEGATSPGRSMIVALGANNQPFWAGRITRRKGGTEPLLQLGTESLHGYLDCRYIGDHTWTNADDISVIAAGLIADADDEGIGFLVDAPPSGHLRDRTYKDKDNKTIYRAMTELSGVIDGPEWTIDLGWEDEDELVVTKTVRVAPRIGVAAVEPNAVFETTTNSVFETVGSSEARYAYDEDYTNGKGANDVVSYSSGQGDAQPFSSHARDEFLLANGWPRYEYRFQPSSSITSVATLNSHAQAKLAVMRIGGKAWVIDARWSVYPRLGVDWRIGDDISWRLLGHRHPDSVGGRGRAIGWSVDCEQDRISLILWEPEEQTEEGEA
jgi:hypothetical protein